MDTSREITNLLSDWRGGDPQVEERLMALIYPHLRQIAARRLPRDDRRFTLETTDLVHEAYLMLLGQDAEWRNRAHFFAVAARLMRRIVIDYARRRSRVKRGGRQSRVDLEEAPELSRDNAAGWLDLDTALDELTRIDTRAARIVELRFFAGMTVDEVARLLRLSSATVTRNWRFARSWLKHRITARDAPAVTV